MRYSLLSRFQGALWGAAIGEELGVYRWRQQPRTELTVDSQRTSASDAIYGWHPGLEEISPSLPLASARNPTVRCAQELIQSSGRISVGLEQLETKFFSTQSTDNSDLAIDLLPILLFLHDDALQVQQVVQRGVAARQQSEPEQAGVLAVGYAIAQALQEQLDPFTLISRTIAYLERLAEPASTSSVLVQRLEHVQPLLERRYGLHKAINKLQIEPASSNRVTTTGAQATTIALAFYCWLSTPDDFKLSVLRAAQVGYLPQTVCAITGALSGAHNSRAGIPVAWQMRSLSQVTAWGISGSEICQLATQLFTVWSGAGDVNLPVTAAAIAAPGLIRPR